MAKSSIKQIESDEKKVIAELRRNSNKSIEKIARDCSFSRQKVWRIIKRLEEDKIIWGYSAIVDEEKQGFKHYIILIKRTTLPVDEKLVDKIITRQLEGLIPESDIIIESSMFTHGIYDWVICFKARELKKAIKFREVVNSMYEGFISDINMLETLFPIRIQGILNPEIEKLKEYL